MTAGYGRRCGSARSAAVIAVTVLLGLTIFAAFDGAPLGYDSYFTLLWGDELAHGQVPDYGGGPIAPAPHPLAIAVAALLAPLGDGTDDAFRLLVVFSFAALCVGVFLLGDELFAWPVGAMAAAIVATRVALLEFATTAFVDIPAAALVMGAAVLEARRPRRGTGVLLLLAAAGLLRPEVWLLSAAYWLWLAVPLDWRSRARYAAVAASAPALWVISDLLVTGDPLWSRQHTRAVTNENELPTGAHALLVELPHHVGGILRADVLALSAIGLAAAAIWLRRRAAVPGALLAMNGVAVVLLALGGLPVLQRFVLLGSVALALFAAVAALGWTALPHAHRARRRWMIAGSGLLVVVIAGTAIEISRAVDLRSQLAASGRAQANLGRLIDEPRAQPVLRRCRPITLAAGQFAGFLAYRTGASPSAFAEFTRPGGVLVVTEPAQTPTGLREPLPRPPPIPSDFRRVAAHDPWVLYAGCR